MQGNCHNLCTISPVLVYSSVVSLGQMGAQHLVFRGMSICFPERLDQLVPPPAMKESFLSLPMPALVVLILFGCMTHIFGMQLAEPTDVECEITRKVNCGILGVVLGHILQCSGVTSSSTLKNKSWKA